MAFKPIDPKRDEYRRYLERGGVIESLTKVLVRILKERPENPVDYLVQNLGYARLQADNVAYLQNELDEARHENSRLTDIIRSINPDLLNKDNNQESCEEDSVVNGGDITVKEPGTQEIFAEGEPAMLSATEQRSTELYVEGGIDGLTLNTHITEDSKPNEE